MIRTIDNLQSIVVVKGGEGYAAYLSFTNERLNLIIHHRDYASLHYLIEQKIAV